MEDDTASIASTCRKCRQRRQRYLDEKCAATGMKYSWQVWREMTPELKFQYENRFSWTLPEYIIRDKRLLQPSLVHHQHPQHQRYENNYPKHQHQYGFPPPRNYAHTPQAR